MKGARPGLRVDLRTKAGDPATSLVKGGVGWKTPSIRLFVLAGVLRGRVNVNWNKDRGLNPDGSERINDRHLTLVEKQAARRTAGIP